MTARLNRPNRDGAANVIPLPTARKSFLAVHKTRRGWEVAIVTHVPGGKPIRTAVAVCNSEAAASDYAKQTADNMGLPFKKGGA